jgi:branched-chain amino acid transport system permease protein
MIIAALFGFLIGFVSLRLKGDYFVLSTLGFQIIIYTILYNWISVTQGPFGIPGIPAPELFGVLKITGIIGFLILSLILLGIVLFIFNRLINSPFGRALKGVRDDEIAMLSLGRNTSKLKIQAFTISSAFSAVSGFLFASYITYIDPTSFSLDESIFIVSAVLIGGTGNIKGPIIGAVFVVLLPEILRFVGLPDNIAANLRMIIYGLALCLFMYIRPQGIVGEYKFQR